MKIFNHVTQYFMSLCAYNNENYIVVHGKTYKIC